MRAITFINESINQQESIHPGLILLRGYYNLKLENYQQAITDFTEVIDMSLEQDRKDCPIPISHAKGMRGFCFIKLEKFQEAIEVSSIPIRYLLFRMAWLL